MNFIPPKPTPDWYGDIIVSEKIDGRYGAIYIDRRSAASLEERPPSGGIVVEEAGNSDFSWVIRAASVFGFLAPGQQDELGFARWVHENAESLSMLGTGIHAGEWWGKGIARQYGISGRRFSLFNVAEFHESDVGFIFADLVPELFLVPVLYRGPLVATNGTDPINEALRRLSYSGSQAAPGFREPEGVVLTHVPSGATFKSLIE